MQKFTIEHLLIVVVINIAQSEIIILETCHHSSFIRNIYTSVIVKNYSCNAGDCKSTKPVAKGVSILLKRSAANPSTKNVPFLFNSII